MKDLNNITRLTDSIKDIYLTINTAIKTLGYKNREVQ